MQNAHIHQQEVVDGLVQVYINKEPLRSECTVVGCGVGVWGDGWGMEARPRCAMLLTLK